MFRLVWRRRMFTRLSHGIFCHYPHPHPPNKPSHPPRPSIDLCQGLRFLSIRLPRRPCHYPDCTSCPLVLSPGRVTSQTSQDTPTILDIVPVLIRKERR